MQLIIHFYKGLLWELFCRTLVFTSISSPYLPFFSSLLHAWGSVDLFIAMVGIPSSLETLFQLGQGISKIRGTQLQQPPVGEQV